MTTSPQPPKKFPIIWIVFGIVAIALIAVVVLTFESGGGSDELGEPEVTGDALPVLPDNTADPAIGMEIPEVVGADFDGSTVSITDDGNAKMIIFVAHWCPHCQREVPIVQDWLDTDPLVDGVDVYTVSTGISRTRDNYPPSEWLEREGWTPPVILDDGASSVGQAFGLPAYPYWVFTNADNQVVARVTGGIAPSDLDNAVDVLAATVQN